MSRGIEQLLTITIIKDGVYAKARLKVYVLNQS